MKILRFIPALAAVLTMTGEAATVYDKDGTSIDIFGRAQVMFMNSRAQMKSAHTDQGLSDSTIAGTYRLGVAGRSTLIEDSLYGIAMAEWDMPTGNSVNDRVSARYMFVGIDAQQYGTLLMGRGDNAYVTVTGATDIFNYLDQRGCDHYLFGDQVGSQLMYTLSSLGWDLRLSYQFASDNINDTGLYLYNGAAFAVSTRLKSDISISYGMSYYDFSYSNSDGAMADFFKHRYAALYPNDALRAEEHLPSYKTDQGVAIAYGTLGRGFYAALAVTATKYGRLPHHIYSYEFVADYAMECGLGFNFGYSLETYRNNTTLVSDLNLGVYYDFGAGFKIFAEAQFDLGAKPERMYANSVIHDEGMGENRYVLGAQYAF